MSRLALACLVSFILVVPPASALSGGPTGRIWVVDSEGIGDFTEIQPAIDSASHGDTILIRYSPTICCYDGFEIDGKSLTLVGFGGGPRNVSYGIVRDLGPNRRLVLSNLDFNWEGRGNTLFGEPTLKLVACDGSVRIQDCRIQGHSVESDEYSAGRPAVRAQTCDDLVIQNSLLIGGTSGYYTGDQGYGAPALSASNSNIGFYESTALGGGGGGYIVGFTFIGLDGGHAISVNSGNAYVSDSTLVGGACGKGDFPGTGGDGLAASSGSFGVARNADMIGGGGYGPNGMPFSGNVINYTSDPALLDVPPSQFEGSSLPIRVRGVPGDEVTVEISRETRRLLGGLFEGYVHTGRPIHNGLRHLGPIPASGEVTFDLEPPILTGNETDRYFLQATLTDSEGTQRRTGVRTIEWLGDPYTDRCLERIHVDPTAPEGGDGESWASAYHDLNAALAGVGECPAGTVTEVWLASGVYTPDGPGGDPDRSFEIRSGTHLLGGFRGVEMDANQRRPDLYPTILSGDLNGDDSRPGAQGDNSGTVVRIGGRTWSARNVRVDGLTIEGAYFPNTSVSSGGGIQIYGDAVLSNLVVRGNQAYRGGGLYIADGTVWMHNCRLLDNLGSGFGGGIHVGGEGTTLELAQCVLAGNRGGNGGGLFALDGPSVRILNSTVVDNHAREGAGIQLYYRVDLDLSNTILWGNRSTELLGQRGQIEVEPFDNSVSMASCCIQDLDGSLGGDGNIGREPLFMGDAPASQAGGAYDLRLAPGSPGIDAGRNDLVPLDTLDLDGDGDVTEPLPFDLNGRPRFVSGIPRFEGTGPHPRVDMGAHEASQPRPRPLGQ